MFLNKTELKTVATQETINLITKSDDSIVEAIINESIALMTTYLSNFYNTEEIFNKEADERNLTVLKYLKDIVIHEVYIRRTHQFNEVAKMRYDEAMNFIENVGKGKLRLDEKLKSEDNDDSTQDNNFIKFSSKKRYKTGW